MKYLLHLSLFIFLLCPNVVKAQDKAIVLYKSAVNAVLNKNLEYALTCLDEGVSQASDPLINKYNYLYGIIYDMYAAQMYANDTDRAYSLYDKAFSYYYTAGEYRRCVNDLIHMSDLQKWNEQYSEALRLLDYANDLSERFSLSAIDVIVKQKQLYEELHQFDKAQQVYSKLFKSYHFASAIEDKFEVLMQLAKDAAIDDNFELANDYYEELDEMIPQFSVETRQGYSFLLYLAKFKHLASLGQFSKCLDLINQGISNYEKSGGEENDLVVYNLDLAYCYAHLNQPELSLEHLSKAYDIMGNLKVDREILLMRFIYTANIYNKLGFHDQALSFYDKASQLGYSQSLLMTSRASTYHAMGKNDLSRAEYEKYSDYVKSIYGQSSLNYAQSLVNLANINAFCGSINAASDYYIEAAKLISDRVHECMRYLSRSHRDSFWEQCSTLLNRMTSFGLRAKYEQNEFTESAYNALLLSKALLLSSDKSLSSVVNESGDVELANLYNQCQKLYTEIEKCRAKGNSDSQFRLLNEELRLQEALLYHRIADNPDYMSFIDADFKSIQSFMDDNEIVIDFTDFPGVDDPERRFYAAFVYRKGWIHPKMLKIFEEKELGKIFRQEDDVNDIYDTKVAKKIDDLLFNRLRSYIQDDDVIYWIPSGKLHSLSIESVLMQSRPNKSFTVRRLSSARVIAENSAAQSYNRSVLYGGLQYNMKPEESISNPDEDNIQFYKWITRSKGHADGFEQLPLSMDEVFSVKNILRAKNMEAEVLSGKKGTEASFIRMSGSSPELIHISTHGFYYTPDEAISINALAGHNNAMMLSGLVLAGGNLEWTSNTLFSEQLGGILTADDIAKLDLSNTDMVVMSACVTGQGKVTADGVYGLQRAFKMAGVKQVLMTLCPVNDYVSNEFMKVFYENLINRGLTPDKALSEAKLSIRKVYKEPKYWAGYVLLD